MKIVVIGGTGLVGSKLVARLREHGHDVVPASPASGVNTLTGEGLTEALTGAATVVDVTNSPKLDDADVALSFFQTSTTNLLAAEAAAGVQHHIALSVVGTDRLVDSGYFRAKLVQEQLIARSPIPYSIVHATQFFEFLESIADAGTDGNTVRVAPVLIQPMAAEDVARALASVCVAPPVNGMVEVAGPEQFRLDDLIRRKLSVRGDPREVIPDASARVFGVAMSDRILLPSDDAALGEIRFVEWLGLPGITPGQMLHYRSVVLRT